MPGYQHYPECEKLAAVTLRTQVILAFLEWLGCEDMGIGEQTDAGFFPVLKSHEFILAQYFDIDMKKIEVERQQMIDAIRSKPR